MMSNVSGVRECNLARKWGASKGLIAAAIFCLPCAAGRGGLDGASGGLMTESNESSISTGVLALTPACINTHTR